ncbi:efflux transporter [Vararia minispora EC-137]|uniref:Efflux transporter n=1 Tax=Vararia minispora EC-137 TaxID=1314806 RepID=A0ACB8QSC2_9AGAM|nr:efflux transporter [Vararia minispora EC-137]
MPQQSPRFPTPNSNTVNLNPPAHASSSPSSPTNPTWAYGSGTQVEGTANSIESSPVKGTEEPPVYTVPERSSRSALRSVGIVAACTSSMMMNVRRTPNASAFPAIALPSIGQDLGVVQADLQWVLNAYAISSACFLLLSGRLADLYGRKRMWLAGYLFISAFGLGYGTTLFVLRGFQGLGGATVIPASLGILAHSFPPSPARSAAFATFAAGAPLGGVIAFFAGAPLVQLTAPAWRSLFYVMAGMSALGLMLGLICIGADPPSTEEDRRVDWPGAFLVTAGLVLIVFVLSASPTAPRGWQTGYIIALFVVGGCLVIGFFFWQYYLERVQSNPDKPRVWWTPPPILKPTMWTRARGRFTVMQIIAAVNWAAFSCWIVWVQLYYQNFLQLTPVLSMVRIVPISIVGVLANIVITLIIGRVDVQYIVTFGTLFTGIAVLLFAIIDPARSYWAYGFPSAIIIVLGADFVFASGTLFVAKVTPPHEQSVAGAVFQAMTLLGTAIGLSISTIVFNGVQASASRKDGVVLDPTAGNAPKDAQLRGYHAAFWTGFAFSMLCVTLSVFLRGIGVVGHPPDSAKRQNEQLPKKQDGEQPTAVPIEAFEA